MAQHIVIKKKNHVASLIATKVNKKRAKMIVDHASDKYATYLIDTSTGILIPAKIVVYPRFSNALASYSISG